MIITKNDTVELNPQVSTGYSFGGQVEIVIRCNGKWSVVQADSAYLFRYGVCYNDVKIPDPELAAKIVEKIEDLAARAVAAIGNTTLSRMTKVGGEIPKEIRDMKVVMSPDLGSQRNPLGTSKCR